MRYTNIDGNMAALAKREAANDAQAYEDEIYEAGASEKPMADMVAAVTEESILQRAFFILLRTGTVALNPKVSRDEALHGLELLLLSCAKNYDKKK